MLPRMLETADRTEEAVRAAGIRAPLMVMRSDGGIMDVREMRRRPILTMLSGPAAGVAAALMHVRISDGVFLEVGGTSTDVSVVRHGRPTVRSGEVGGHRLYVRTLDIRTVGIGGGSMVRADERSVRDVGPRSAHIAGLGYPSFAPPPSQAALELLRIAPRPGDPGDYLAIRVSGEERPSLTLTPTEAAKALDLTSVAPANAAAARVVDWIAGRLGTTSGELARAVLRVASAKVAAVVERLVADYGLERRHLVLVGGGGGAEAIVPFTAEALGLGHRIAERAEVISAIGAALGMIQDSVERNVVNPTADDLISLRREAVESVVRMGAAPDSVDVKVEVDPRQKTITATARGTPDLRTRAPAARPLEAAEIEAIAARDFEAGTNEIVGVGQPGPLCVYAGQAERRRLFGLLRATLHPVRVIDREGVVRLRLSDALMDSGLLPALLARLPERMDELTAYGDAGGLLPDVFFVVAGRVVDLSGLATREQVLSVLRTETEPLGRDEPAVALLSRRQA
jgi:hypothetical protein